jgi:hypothetical protein
VIASKRERIIGLLTAGVLAVLALDRLVWTPLMARSDDVAARLDAANAELELADNLFSNRGRMDRRWDAMLASGIKADVPEAESHALDALRGFGKEAGVTLTSLKPDRTETREHFRVVFLSTSCTGSMRSIADFLWRVQTTQVPMRVTFMQVSARRPGTDDLSLQLGVSTLCLAPPPDPSKTPAPGGGRARPGTSVASAGGATATSFGREGAR